MSRVWSQMIDPADIATYRAASGNSLLGGDQVGQVVLDDVVLASSDIALSNLSVLVFQTKRDVHHGAQ